MSYIDLGLVGLTGQPCAFGDRTVVWQVMGEKGLGKAKCKCCQEMFQASKDVSGEK